MSRGTKGAADAAAPRLARKRGDKPTIANNVSLARDPRILNWVRARTREGFGTKQLVAASRASEDDWPRPGEQLSDGVLASCRAAIHHLEEQGARWPLKDDGGALRKAKRGPTRTGKRLSELGAKRAAARRAGDPIVLWDTCYDITRLTGLLESLNIEDVDLDEHSLDTVNDLHDDMLFLQDWMDRSIGSVQARLGEHGIRQKIRALRAKTVANGCTPEEEAASQRAADRLEHQLRARLGVAS